MPNSAIDRDIHGVPTYYHDFKMEMAKGLIPDHACVNKFGRNTNVDATKTDIWDLASQPVRLAPTAARTHAIKSTNVADTPGSGGCWTVRFWGLLDWDTAEVFHDVTLAGSESVNTTSDFVIMHRMEAITYGNSGPNIGVITATAETDGSVTCQINSGEGQTQMAIYGIPSTQKFLMGRLYGNMNRAGGATPLADVSMKYNTSPQSWSHIFKTKHTFGLSGAGTSALTINYANPKVFNGPGIIKLEATGSTTNLDVSGGFDGCLYTV